MNLLFDQNISSKVLRQLSGPFHGAKHVRLVGLEDASDLEIFEFAKINNLAIVTFDSDFVDLNVLRSSPPKIIWIRTGNLTTKSVAELLNKNIKSIIQFLNSVHPNDEVLEIIKSDL